MRKYIIFTMVVAFSLLVTGCNKEIGNQPQENDGNTAVEEQDNDGSLVEKEEVGNDDVEKGVSSESNGVVDSEPKSTQNDPSHEKKGEDTPTTAVEEDIPQYEVTSDWRLSPLTEEANEKVVLLTIDDAPDENALEMAKTLKKLNASAIFFVNGHFLDTEEEKEVLRKIHQMGFPIGNHTYNHQRLSEVSEEKQKEEIVSLSNLIEDIIGERPKFFRAPNGVNTDYATSLVKEEGMLLMNWWYGYDWDPNYMTEESLTDIMVNNSLLADGSIFLLHDRDWTAKALDDIIKGVREKGFEIADPNLIKGVE